MTNTHGLSRSIPDKIKRSVRQRCGYGCVICGNAIYEYDHFDPEFKDSKKHSEDKITLLCMQCHGKKTRGFLSLKKVKQANDNPKAKQNGFFENFDFGGQYPKVFIGSNVISNCQNIILVEGKSILKIDPPEEKGAPFLLSGCFFDENSNGILKINKNEWRGNPESWDVETTAGRIIIKTKATYTTTVLDVDVKDLPNQLTILNLNMKYKEHRFLVSKDKFTYVNPNGGNSNFKGCHFISEVIQKSYVLKILEGRFYFMGIEH